MKLNKTKRKFSTKEVRFLKLIIQKHKTEVRFWNSYKLIFISFTIGVPFAIIAANLNDGILLFLTGTIAVFAFVGGIFSIVPCIKDNKKKKTDLKNLNKYLSDGYIGVSDINAQKIAKASEYEDESDLYIVKINDFQTLFVWDYEYNLDRKFPCLHFEIYEKKFYELTNQIINFKSEKITPINIAPENKWNYLRKNGISKQIELIDINFDVLVNQINNCS